MPAASILDPLVLTCTDSGGLLRKIDTWSVGIALAQLADFATLNAGVEFFLITELTCRNFLVY